ncbi:MAG: 2-hydroxyglutaryl-CoA dehydratase [Dehalococcoidia bacterium]|nr:MAG: 2-hydroxyglutaryl-CoA dehydratase [Dehalococcoidia bacterium]
MRSQVLGKTVEAGHRAMKDEGEVLVAGIDVGSAFSKAVILNSAGAIFYHSVATRGDFSRAAHQAMEEVTSQAGLKLEDIGSTVATGVGAANAPLSDDQVPEISCQGKGTKHLFPSVRTIIDVGDQASRVIRIDDEGRPIYFVVSEKCAAGSGRFLQIMARVLQMDISEIGVLSLKSTAPVTFGTNCAVFAESEAISRIAEGASKSDLLAGIHIALAAKIHSMVERVGLEMDCTIVGGGAKDSGLVKRLEDKLGVGLLIPQEPHITAALGAAIIARERNLLPQTE